MAEEVELTLRVISPDPEEVFRSIVSMPSVGSFRLAPRGSAVMRDTYLDTPGFDLGKKGYALRLRAKGGVVMLTLKGREKERSGGGISRLEIEGLWSREVLLMAAREIGPGFIKTEAFEQAGPLKCLKAMGLAVIQDRETARSLIDAFHGDEKTPFGEIALDRVRYVAAGKGYLHYELEIEAKGSIRPELLSECARSLREAFPGKLEPWEFNKLITGFALEELLRQGEQSQARGESIPLPLSWYGAMEAWIREKKSGG